MDLTKRTPQKLKNLLANNGRHGQTETVLAVLQEMARRGIATKRRYSHLTWNQDRVAKVFQPFKDIASGVIGSERVVYTEAGGAENWSIQKSTRNGCGLIAIMELRLLQ